VCEAQLQQDAPREAWREEGVRDAASAGRCYAIGAYVIRANDGRLRPVAGSCWRVRGHEGGHCFNPRRFTLFEQAPEPTTEVSGARDDECGPAVRCLATDRTLSQTPEGSVDAICVLRPWHAGPHLFPSDPIPDPPAPTVTAPAGVKHDQEKLRWTLIPWDSLEEIVRVLEFGARKYAPDNWKIVPGARLRYLDALLRHVAAYAKGERVDPESRLSTLGHVGCCVLFLLWFDKQDTRE